jgi:hypothetical protein
MLHDVSDVQLAQNVRKKLPAQRIRSYNNPQHAIECHASNKIKTTNQPPANEIPLSHDAAMRRNMTPSRQHSARRDTQQLLLPQPILASAAAVVVAARV